MTLRVLCGIVLLRVLHAGDEPKRPKTQEGAGPVVRVTVSSNGIVIRGIQQPTLSRWIAMCKSIEPNTAEKKKLIERGVQTSQRYYEGGPRAILENTLIIDKQTELYYTPLEAEMFEAVFAEYMERFPPTEPQVYRLDVPQGSIVVLRADIHADVWSLLAQLNDMKNRGYMDDDFRITNEQVYMLFLGDFTDRGNAGLETVYTMLRLKIANPLRVIIVRGNHETKGMVEYMGFAAEFMHKLYPIYTGRESSSEETDSSEEEDGFYEEDIAEAIQKFDEFARWYDTMPVAVFLGSTFEGRRDYVQCCHGGIDFFDARGLFSAPARAYAGGAYLAQVAYRQDDHRFAEDVAVAAQSAGDMGAQGAVTGYINRILKNKKSKALSCGFLWSDFTFGPEEQSTHNEHRGIEASKKLTESVLKAYSAQENVTVHGVIRGHQHGGDVIVNYYLPPRGLYRHWIESDKQEFASTFYARDGVYTFNVAPNNLYGFSLESDPAHIFDFDTYAYLTIQGPFAQWRFERINNQTLIKNQS